MLALHPPIVTFAGRALSAVSAITIDRAAESLVEEWDDFGPHPAFVDVPAQRITIKLVQTLDTADRSDQGEALLPPIPGERDTLEFCTAPARADGDRRMVAIPCTVTAVRHELGPRAATRTITFAACAGSGEVDPVAIMVL
ncbi:MAG: hypothetical protein ACT4PL_11250 [Phycisphaerales bacterium]